MSKELTEMLQEEIEENSENLEHKKNAKKIEEKNQKNSEKKEENNVFSAENAENSDLENLEKKEKNAEKISEDSTEENSELEAEYDDEDWDNILEDLDLEDDSQLEEDEEDWELEDDEDDEEGEMAESDEDPLLKEVEEQNRERAEEPKTTNIEDIKQKVGGSEKNTKNLNKLTLLAMDRVDVFKATLCSKISGKHVAEYVADDELKEALIEAIKEYLATQEFKEPTPFQTLMLALGMWTLPPLGMAFWDKYGIGAKKEKTSTSSIETETSKPKEKGEQKSDFSHLKEYKEQRKIFSVTAEGYYNRTPQGTFIKVALADEKPSPQVQEWLEMEYSNKQIRELLNYGK